MFLELLFFLIVIAIYFVFHFLTKKHNYWKERNVRYLKPSLIFGNYSEYLLFKKYGPEVAGEICQKFPNEPYIGTFYGTEPALLIQDPDLIKLITTTTDAMHFSGRENTDYGHSEIITKNVFFTGGDEWKVLRQILSPLFTTAKMKNMFPLITESAKELDAYLDAETKARKNIVAQSVLAKYTMSTIISCVFGFNPNTLKRDVKEVNPFVTIGARIFDQSIFSNLKLVCRSMWPYLFYQLGFKLFDDSIPKFFSNLFVESYRSRQKSGTTRNDLIDLFTELKKNNTYITSESYFTSKNGKKKEIILPINDDFLSSTSLAFFGAGFETTSNTSAFVLFELAKHKNAQDRVIEEVDTYFQKHKNQIEYECLNELPYLEACINETLRLYPPIGILTREVMGDYVLPTGLHLKKGDRIHIAVHGLHRDPRYFPNPEEFYPERFLGEERNKINPYVYMPFGIGARSCLGKRLAKMQLHPGLLTIFKKYRVELSENTPHSLSFMPIGLNIQPKTIIYLKFIQRDNNGYCK